MTWWTDWNASIFLLIWRRHNMNTIYAKYNMYHNSIDIYTSAGYVLRIDCNKAEDGLKATPRSQYSLYALAAFQWGSGINNLSSDYFFNL